MQAKLMLLIARLEALSLREQLMVLIGLPVVIAVICEFLVFEPAAKRTAAALAQAAQQEKEVAALNELLAAQPAVAALPALEQMQRERNALRAQLEAAAHLLAGAKEAVDWGSIVRATAVGTSGLTLTQMRAQPAEVVFSPSSAKTGAAKPGAPMPTASAPAVITPASVAASAVALATGDTLYRHRADLTVQGDFTSLLAYLQSLQRLPGDLRWSRLDLNAAAYPKATLQLTLQILSTRAETPFN